jgi:hypothetical protein
MLVVVNRRVCDWNVDMISVTRLLGHAVSVDLPFRFQRIALHLSALCCRKDTYGHIPAVLRAVC